MLVFCKSYFESEAIHTALVILSSYIENGAIYVVRVEFACYYIKREQYIYCAGIMFVPIVRT